MWEIIFPCFAEVSYPPVYQEAPALADTVPLLRPRNQADGYGYAPEALHRGEAKNEGRKAAAGYERNQ